MNRPWLDETLAANGCSVRHNFQAWFGSSVLRDAQGEPLRLFHGTRHDFDAFRRNPFIAGYFFTRHPDYAGYIAGVDEDEWSGQATVAAYVRMERPLDVTQGLDPKLGRKLLRHGARKAQLEWLINPASDQWMVFQSCEHGHEFARAASLAGFDGMVFNENSHETAYAVFSAFQMKSAIGNSGLYARGSASLTDHALALELDRSQRAKVCIERSLKAPGRSVLLGQG